MIQTRHCDLCEFPKRNLKNGLTCGLTDKKPDFIVSCSKIKFSNSFKEYASKLLNKIEHSKKRKKYVYLNFIVLLSIGLTIIFGSYTLLEKNFDMEFDYSSWMYSKQTSLIYIVGTVFISMALWNLKKYRKPLKKLQSDKRKIDIVLEKYSIDFETLLNCEKE